MMQTVVPWWCGDVGCGGTVLLVWCCGGTVWVWCAGWWYCVGCGVQDVMVLCGCGGGVFVWCHGGVVMQADCSVYILYKCMVFMHNRYVSVMP